MRKRNLILSAIAIFVMASSPLFADVVVISNDFDGDNADGDLGGAFVIVSNGIEDNDTTAPSTGLLQFQDTDTSNPAVGFTSSTGGDLSSFDGFNVEWVVASGFNTQDVHSNGWFFGVQDAVGVDNDGTTLWNNAPDAIGVTLFRNTDITAFPPQGTTAHFVESLAANGDGEDLVSVGSVNNAVAEDGFTISLTVNSDDTWSVSSVGLDAGTGELSGSGTLVSGTSYADFADNLFASSVFQIRNDRSVDSGGQYSSVTVTGITAVPEPSSLAVLGLAGLAGFVRRRR